MKRISLVTFAALGALLNTAPGALAKDTLCSTLVGPPTYATTTPQSITGNLTVDIPNCELKGGGTVTGNVTVQSGNSLELEGVWVIGGNLTASNCTFVNLNTLGPILNGQPFPNTTTVGGSVKIQNCTGGLGIGWAFFTGTAGSVFMGDFHCESNNAECYLIGATVGGSVFVKNNVASPFTMANSTVKNNQILTNLECSGNSPAPLAGLGTNTVLGNPGQNNEGQCLDF